MNESKYFSFDGLQNFLAFDLIIRNSVPSGFSTEVKTDRNNKITSWKSAGMSREKNYKYI